MNETFDYFKKAAVDPEALFSADNPVIRATTKVHRGLFEALDSSARANLSLASDLLGLNRKRIEQLYTGKPLTEQLQSQADILFETGQRFAAWSDELREAAAAFRSSVTELGTEWLEQPAAEPRKTHRKTAKAA
jgi:hypothetical protein